MNKFYQKKIAFITPYYYPIGPAGSDRDQRLIKTLSKNNQVTIISSDSSGVRYWHDLLFFKKIRYSADNVIRLKHSPNVSFILNLIDKLFSLIKITNLSVLAYGPQINERELLNIISEGNFDYVYLTPLPHRLILQTVNVIRKLEYKPKIILRPNFHSYLPIFKNKIFQHVYDQVNFIHVFTEEEGKLLRQTFKIDKNKFVISPALIDRKRILSPGQLKKEQLKFVNKYHLKNKYIITYIGVKNRLKGIFFLLKSLSKLYKSNKEIVLITIGSNTFVWSFYKKIFKIPFLIDLNYVDSKQKEIITSISDVICIPSIAESYGLVYLEAWKFKKPVIGINTIINEKIIAENKAGLTVEYNNITSLIRAINYLIKNKRKSQKFGLNGYKQFNSLDPTPLLKIFNDS